MNLEKALVSDRFCRAITGMSPAEIHGLLPTFETLLLERAKRQKRKRAIGAGRKDEAIVTNLSKLLFILFYLKIYPTFDLVGLMMDRHKSRPCRWVQSLLPILAKTLGRNLVLPTRKIETLEDMFKHFPETRELFVDGTERRIQRPKNPKNQKNNYSGKKKNHTRKNIVISNQKKEVLYVSPTTKGSKHDYSITKSEMIPQNLPPDIPIYVDTGFQGIKDLVKNPKMIFMPKKKPRNGNLTTEREGNQ